MGGEACSAPASSVRKVDLEGPRTVHFWAGVVEGSVKVVSRKMSGEAGARRNEAPRRARSGGLAIVWERSVEVDIHPFWC